MRQQHGSLLALAKAIEADIQARQLNAAQAMESAADKVFVEGRGLLSGSVPTATLRQRRHPFGRGFTDPKGRPRAFTRALPINVQSDSLRRSWVKSREGNKIRLGFSRPPSYAKYVLSDRGTREMRARGFNQAMDKRVKVAKLGIREGLKGKR